MTSEPEGCRVRNIIAKLCQSDPPDDGAFAGRVHHKLLGERVDVEAVVLLGILHQPGLEGLPGHHFARELTQYGPGLKVGGGAQIAAREGERRRAEVLKSSVGALLGSHLALAALHLPGSVLTAGPASNLSIT